MKHHDEWWEFKDEVWKRLVKGEAVYGEATFEKTPAAITHEIDEEILDVAAYAFMLWCRVKALRARLTDETFHPLQARELSRQETDRLLSKLKRDLG